jgi:hypothetical protein
MVPGLQLYGENSFTFLLFRGYMERGGLVDGLICRLKQFGSAARFDEDIEGAPRVWLFPNFGKSRGFGEPDALVLVGTHCFWFEVETRIALGHTRHLTSALRQLYRFHLAADAMSRPSKERDGARRICGPTITDRDNRKEAELIERDHAVVPSVRKAVRDAHLAGRSHYVLLMDAKPRGSGKFGSELGTFASKAIDWFTTSITEPGCYTPAPPRLERFYYAYWEGHLNSWEKSWNPLDGYLPIKLPVAHRR